MCVSVLVLVGVCMWVWVRGCVWVWVRVCVSVWVWVRVCVVWVRVGLGVGVCAGLV